VCQVLYALSVSSTVCFKCVKYSYETVIVPVALGLQNSMYCEIIMADINKIATFVFPQPFVNNEKEKRS